MEILENYLGGLAFTHVNKQGPRRATEPDQRHSPFQLPAGQRDRPVHIIQLSFQRKPQFGDILHDTQGVREDRPFFFFHGDFHAHGSRNHQNIAENNAGVQSIALDRLERDLASKLGSLAHLEEGMRFAHLSELRQVAPGLPHEPNRQVRNLLLVEHFQKRVVFKRGEGLHKIYILNLLICIKIITHSYHCL